MHLHDSQVGKNYLAGRCSSSPVVANRLMLVAMLPDVKHTRRVVRSVMELFADHVEILPRKEAQSICMAEGLIGKRYLFAAIFTAAEIE